MKKTTGQEDNTHNITNYSEHTISIRSGKRFATTKATKPIFQDSKQTTNANKPNMRNKSSKQYVASYNIYDDFQQDANSHLPRMQQIIEHNKQVDYEKRLDDMRNGHKDPLAMKKAPSQFKQAKSTITTYYSSTPQKQEAQFDCFITNQHI